MEYIWAFLILIGIFGLTSIFTGLMGLLIPILYSLLGFILGAKYLIIGLGGLCGSILNIYSTKMYIRTQGAMSNAPRYSKIASIGYIIFFIPTIIVKYIFNIEINNIPYLYLFIFAFVAWIVLSILFRGKKIKSINNFYDSVSKFKIVAKYKDDPKWAIYLYFNTRKEDWNKTIPGSFLAKDPEKDLTFVFSTKEKALIYARDSFKNAEYIEE
jgi:hypothetical protein